MDSHTYTIRLASGATTLATGVSATARLSLHEQRPGVISVDYVPAGVQVATAPCMESAYDLARLIEALVPETGPQFLPEWKRDVIARESAAAFKLASQAAEEDLFRRVQEEIGAAALLGEVDLLCSTLTHRVCGNDGNTGSDKILGAAAEVEVKIDQLRQLYGDTRIDEHRAAILARMEAGLDDG